MCIRNISKYINIHQLYIYTHTSCRFEPENFTSLDMHIQKFFQTSLFRMKHENKIVKISIFLNNDVKFNISLFLQKLQRLMYLNLCVLANHRQTLIPHGQSQSGTEICPHPTLIKVITWFASHVVVVLNEILWLLCIAFFPSSIGVSSVHSRSRTLCVRLD